MKKLLGILVLGYRIMWDKLDLILDLKEIKQKLSEYEWRKVAPTLENHTGSWWLFNGLAVHLGSPLLTLVDTSYADNLKSIKNKPHKDSLKISVKLETDWKQER